MQVSRGEFVPTYKYDILCKATDRYDHPGRVRGYSTHTCQREVFGDNSCSQVVDKSRYKKLEKELEMTKKAMLNGFKIMARKCGMTLPNILEDINSEWEPPSSGSNNSPSKIRSEQDDPIPSTEYDEMTQDMTTPKVVCILFISF